jgi:hypothetical protein
VIEGDFQAPNWLDLQRLHHNHRDNARDAICSPSLQQIIFEAFTRLCPPASLIECSRGARVLALLPPPLAPQGRPLGLIASAEVFSEQTEVFGARLSRRWRSSDRLDVGTHSLGDRP